MTCFRSPISAVVTVMLALTDPVFAQHEGHGHHAAPDSVARQPAQRRAQPRARQRAQQPAQQRAQQPAQQRAQQPAQQRAPEIHHHHHVMEGALGPYGMSREGSGTAWQPEAAPHPGLHAMRGPWHAMLHGAAQAVATRQGGDRGGDDLYGNHMLMGMAGRAVGRARLGLRAMLSLEPATIGRQGYPLLLQTGETADGVEHLIDRQHPHELWMELSTTLSVSSGNRSAFVYGALSGEPALGPPVFMHRFSGETFPEAPITHHWLDSSHITFGVLTGGVTWGAIKLDASAFRGREPDQNRWNIERPDLDSHSFRVSWNPTAAWALQTSHAYLESPEQLDPDLDIRRTTASVIHHQAGRQTQVQTTLAWGRNDLEPGGLLDAWLLESTLELRERHRWFGRAEHVEKDELFHEGDPRAGQVFTVGKLGLGYIYQGWRTGPVRWGLGAFGTVSFVPESIQDVYGSSPISGSAILQARLQ
jgi:hypothetical protein